MAVGDTYRVRHRGRLRGARVETGYYLTAAQAPGDPDDAAGAAVAVVQPLLDAATSLEVNWDEIVVSDVSAIRRRAPRSQREARTRRAAVHHFRDHGSPRGPRISTSLHS